MIRRLVSTTLHRTGAMSLWRKLHRQDICFLTVHSVLAAQAPGPWTPLRSFLPLENFRENLRFLKGRCTFLAMDEALAILEGRAEPVDNGIVLTFDDGYLNNFQLALSVLDELGIPATFFIVTDRVERRQPFWFDRVDYALQHNVPTSGARLEVLGTTVEVASDDRSELRRAMLECFSLLLNSGINDRQLEVEVEGIIAPIEALAGKALGDDYDEQSPCAIVTKPLLKAAAENPLVTLGSHTHNHVRLPTLTDDEIAEELALSGAWLRTNTGQVADVFCYPNGSYDLRSAKLVARGGFRAALTCDDGQNTVADYSPFAVRRVNWSVGASPVELLALSCGAFRDFRSGRTRQWVDESAPPVQSRPVRTGQTEFSRSN